MLILDEPTNGLDPQGIKELREFIRRLAETGLSLFISSHLLSEIQQMCDRVAIISRGEVIKVGEVSALMDESASTVVWKAEPVEKVLESLRSRAEVEIIDTLTDTEEEAGAGRELRIPQILTRLNPEAIPSVSRQLVEAGVQLYGIEIKHPTLEDLFLELTEGERIG
ncbi:hypothetical protein LJK88_30045 [Paenibacillus sp. P26]|nr:hypothetical protein LJK88_30045 [Paenibacillus sp. P26]